VRPIGTDSDRPSRDRYDLFRRAAIDVDRKGEADLPKSMRCKKGLGDEVIE
jgi:hypothetical protein